MNECIKLPNVCLYLGDSLPTQTLTFVDDVPDPIDISAAVVTVDITKTDTSTPALSYTLASDAEVTVSGAGNNVLEYFVGAVDMATLALGTYTLAVSVALGTSWTRSAIQRLEIKKVAV